MRYTTLLMIAAVSLVSIGCNSSSTHIIGKTRPAIAAQEVIINPNKLDYYEVIGTIKVEANSGWTIHECHENALAQLKEEAASLGANAVILLPLNDEDKSQVGKPTPNSMGGTSTVPFLSPKQAVLAKAIYVPDELDKDRNALSGLIELLPMTPGANPYP